ncbi:MAG TPA: hypothetical protein VHD31_03280 [Candidatus Paceibacterota bacterium]|nr:hypothetical protein [Candidatus Paceibacterota bacterium]
MGASTRCLDSAEAIANCLTNVVINPIIALIFAAGLLVFVYGIVEFMWGMQGGEADKSKGKQHMLWGIIGMFIMVAAYTILKIVANTINAPLPH